MKVLMTADTVGGVWTYAMELAKALAAFDVDVVLASMGTRPSNEQRRDVHACGNVELEESAFRLEWMQNPWSDVDLAGDWLLALETRHAPDVIHLNGYAHGALPWNAPTLVVGHSCVRSWWTAVRAGGNPDSIPAEWNEYTRRVRAGLLAAEIVVAPTHAMLNALIEHYGPLPRAEVIPNGRDAKLFSPARKESLIVSAGRVWDEAKNVAALARVADRLPWPVVVAGNAVSPDGTIVDLPEHVRWLGQVTPSELAEWMGRASLYVLPARYEPFGLSALEAALSGCALVLGDIDSLREIWGPSDAAVFVSPDDDDSLIDAISRLCNDGARRHHFSRRARARALELSPQRMAERYVATYARLRASHAAPEATVCAS